uniref:probable carboxylesterase 2 n=1 Tax=Erigeron canadensis TaxID=72917 RepID=UPI001CB8DF58|nr:probable carboxylesterase 2 [Erigeron canadensis]
MEPSFPSKYISTSQEFPLHFHGILRMHKDGKCERFLGNDLIPAGFDPLTGIESKDVIISFESNIFVRLYIPKTIIIRNHKLPIVIYYHGGAFVTQSAASSTYHPTLNLITKQSNVIIVSVNYRLAPEYPIPIAYEDSWEAVKWVASHSKRDGPEPWLNERADFQRVFFAGDSSGANIAHNMAIRVGLNKFNVINLKGVIMLHPFFGGKDPIGDEIIDKNKEYKMLIDHGWKFAYPSGNGSDDPLFNPAKDPNISSFGCSKILLCVAEKDRLRDRGLNYKKVMEKSGWRGKIELIENKGDDHVFFLYNPSSDNARAIRDRICSFINIPIRCKA